MGVVFKGRRESTLLGPDRLSVGGGGWGLPGEGPLHQADGEP